jgi:hypothetical protein
MSNATEVAAFSVVATDRFEFFVADDALSHVVVSLYLAKELRKTD